MEVKKGYKQTEVGIIPNEWELLSYSQAFIFLNTASFSRDKLDSFSKTGYIHYGDIHTKWKHFVDVANDPVPKISSTLAKGFTIIKKGDLIMADASEDTEGVGKSVEVLNEGDNETIAGLHTFLLRDKTGEFIDGFKGYIHSMNIVKKQVNKLATGMKVFGISKSNLKEIKIPVPTKSEQSAIAAVLSQTDSLITNIEKLIAKKDAVKKGIMQALLTGKKRLPGFNEKWEYKTLGEIGECFIGLTYTPSDVSESGLLVLRSSNIKNSSISFDDTVYVDIAIPEKLITKKGDILICVRNGSRNLIGKCALINKQAANQTFGAFMSVFRSVHNDFIFHVFQSNIIKKQIDENIGATINQITNKNLNSFKIPFPNKEEQDAITEVLNDLSKERVQLEEKLTKYKQLKIGLMYQLLSGKIRLA